VKDEVERNFINRFNPRHRSTIELNDVTILSPQICQKTDAFVRLDRGAG